MSGPADATAEQLEGLESLDNLPIDQPEDPVIDAPIPIPTPIEEAPPRSFDF